MNKTILALAVGLLTVSTSEPNLHANGHISFVPLAEAAMSSKLGDLTPWLIEKWRSARHCRRALAAGRRPILQLLDSICR